MIIKKFINTRRECVGCTTYRDGKDLYKQKTRDNKDIYPKIKRYIDIILAIIFSILVSPLVIFIAIAIKLESKGPIIFKQTRSGKDGKPFEIYKFRTMKEGTPNVPTNQINKSGCEITKVGKFLRKSSLDEIPQLINILKKDMTFIGPRPVIVSETKLINLRKEKGIDSLYPGISGWAQVNGRDEIDIYEKVKYDYEYLQNISLKFDLKIAFITGLKVLKSEGIRD